MGDRDTLRNLVIAGGVFLLIMVVLPALIPTPTPPTPGSTDPGTAEIQPVDRPATTATTVPADSTGPAQIAAPSQPTTVYHLAEAPAEQFIEIGASLVDGVDPHAPPPPYRMGLRLCNVGASIDTATFTDHREDVHRDAPYTMLEPIERATGGVWRSLAIENINIDGHDIALADAKWHAHPEAETSDGQSVSFSIDVLLGEEPALRLTRTIHLPKQDKALGRHDLDASLRIENVSRDTHTVVVTYLGGLGVRQASSRGGDHFIDWGIDDGSLVVAKRHTGSSVTSKSNEPLPVFKPSPSDRALHLSWAATANTYFTCTIAPEDAGAGSAARSLAEVTAVDLDGSSDTVEDTTIRFVTTAATLAPTATLVHRTEIYLGEKDGDAFRAIEDYSRRSYYDQISMGFGMCTFGWLIELMIWLLNSLHDLSYDYGVAIVVLVLIVRLLLHPITKKGQINMVRMQHRMQEMAPKIEEIKKKYANDKARLNQEMMKLNINPAGQLMTCLPMFIQMPIWVALFLSLSGNIGMRHEAAFWGLTWISDLTAPDALIRFSTPLIIPGVGWELASFNLLPLFVALFMYIQQKLQPKPAPNPNQTDQQKQQQDMMKMMMPMMSIMMLLFFYNAPSGLNLYIMCSSMFGAIEQHRIRKHIKEQEAAGTLHAPPKKKKKDDTMGKRRPGRMSFLERMQKMADEAHKAQARRPGGKPKARR